MKLKNLISQRHRSEVVRQFDDAKLVRLPNGWPELIGARMPTALTALNEFRSSPMKLCSPIPIKKRMFSVLVYGSRFSYPSANIC
jgi:hypothetical protein